MKYQRISKKGREGAIESILMDDAETQKSDLIKVTELTRSTIWTDPVDSQSNPLSSLPHSHYDLQKWEWVA